MKPSPKQYNLPDLHRVCILKGATNPHYFKAASASRAWVDSFNLKKIDDSKRMIIKRSSAELLASYTFPYTTCEQLRTCCDLLNLLFVVDEVSDDQSGAGARDTGEVFLNALRNPQSDDQSILARMTKQFRARLVSQSRPNAVQRFVIHCETYIAAVIEEAKLRERGEVLDLDSFTRLRRENSAIRVCFCLAECMLGVDLPDDVFEDPAFLRVYWAAADMVCWSNDVYSYNMEQAKGHSGNNVVTVLMKARAMDLQTASDYVGVHFEKLMNQFITNQRDIKPRSAEIDADVVKFIEAMGYWVRGCLDWSFRTERYFGSDVAIVRRTHKVTVRPRE